MNLERIITLASPSTRLELLAMERSLRAVGCTLPLWVIPYNEERFALPSHAQWWPMPELYDWLAHFKGRPVNRKYQCLLERNYQFVDTDVVFLKNPQDVLSPCTGFIASCGHWNNPNQTQTAQTRALLSQKSTTWQRWVFNSGQFACDRALYADLQALKNKAESPALEESVLNHPYHEQPGFNALVVEAGIDIHNLTLPPTCMESTWAGDYLSADYAHYWKDPAKMPYFLHWAGRKPSGQYAIDELFLKYLSPTEKEAYLKAQQRKKPSVARQLLNRLRAAYRTFNAMP